MDAVAFVDYYEILEISPNANTETIERVFRYLAQRYHPDNPATGDRARFDEVVEAHNVLKDSVKRAQYDVRHKSHSAVRWRLAEEAGNGEGVEHDAEIQERMLSIFYTKRRQNIHEPGVDMYSLERLLNIPREHLEFHLWYMRQKGWIERDPNGVLAITAEGVDRASSEHYRKTTTRLITDQHSTQA
jgi:curved DNA-binding protein CbpA